MKLVKFLRIFVIVFIGVFIANYAYLYFTPHYTPKTRPIDLNILLEQPSFSQEDYALLFEQTGLAQPIIDELHTQKDFKTRLLGFQKDYLADIMVSQTYMPPATFCQIVGKSPNHKVKAFTLAPYHNGYLLFTDATHTFGWRHGHIGLVVDEIHGITLEALRPGMKSCLQNIHKWEYYPTFKMMRLKSASQKELDKISNYALEQLNGLPYNILGTKKQDTPEDTHCSLLVWQAFMHFGYDLDATGGWFVSPKDIACSPLLERLQIYGFNPNKDW